MTIWELTGGFFLVAVGGTIAGALGFGGGMVIVPFLVLINPAFVPVPIVLMTPFFTGLVAWRERDSIDPSVLKWIAVGFIPAMGAGSFTLIVASEETLGIVIGLLLLAVIGLQITRPQLRRTASTLVLGGGLGGFMANTVGIPTVGLALAMSHFEGPTFRATLNTCTAFLTVISIVVLTAANQVGGSDLVAATVLTLGSTVGFVLSGPVRHVVDRRGISQMVYAVASLGAITLLVRSMS
ncbi:MAG: sulfite exporter TauE/SafE family protein [Acidimicrobiales bacterium]|nr:sulfite exporter TauE/SafE family protein [Acidimicrobiales bacterium]